MPDAFWGPFGSVAGKLQISSNRARGESVYRLRGGVEGSLL